MTKLNGLILACLTFFISLSASANLDITCTDDDCFTYGWEAYDTQTGDGSAVICREGGCLVDGWNTEYKGRMTSEVLCKPDGCFNEGWNVFSTRTGEMLADVSCQTSFATSDCLQFGWVTSEPNRRPYITRCVNGDCRNIGWDVRVPNYRPQPVRCKRGGCFTSGWTVYR